MPIEQDITALVSASNNLTGIVTNKIDDIDSKVNTTLSDMEAWKVNALTSTQAKTLVSPGSQQIIDLSHLSNTLFYPVILGGSAEQTNEYEISRYYAAKSGLTGEDTLASLFLKFSFVGHTWGGNPQTIMIHRNEQTYRMTASVLGLANYHHPMVFLLGGYEYKLFSNIAEVPFTLYETKTEYYKWKPNVVSAEYDSSCGPIDAAASANSAGALTVGPVYNTEHTHYIGRLGG